jgi:peptidyl-prolyl cis-trans isomerase D
MSRIRNNIVLVVVLIAVAILAFTVQDTLSNLVGGGGGTSNVGEVAGQEISIQDFNERYQLLLNNQRSPGAPPLTDQQVNQTLDNTWSQMVNEIIINNEKEEIGLQVTGAELADMFTGRNVSQYVRNYFGGFFDSPQAVEAGYTQGFSGENVRKYIQTLQDQGTPQQKLDFKNFETNLKDFREQERFDNMLRAAYAGSSTMARERYLEKTRTYDISYVSVPYASISDSLIDSDVSDADYKKFIAENEFRYEQKAATVIQYVVYDIAPTAADSAAARQELIRDQERFQLAKNDSTFTLGKTRTPYNNQLSEISDVPRDIQDAVLNATAGTVWGPYLDAPISFTGGPTEAYYKLYKLVEAETSEDDVWAKIRYKNVPFGTDTTASESEASTLLAKARNLGMDSLDAAVDAGWYTKGRLGEEVDEAVKSASVGSIIGPIKSTGGWAIIEVQNKTNKRFGIADIENFITYSDATKRSVDKEVSLFAAKAMDMKSVETAASEEGVISYPSQELTVETPATSALTGVKEGSRQLVRWALGAKDGEFSEIMEAGNAFVFAQVIDKKSPGTRSVSELRGVLKTQVFNRKKAEIIKGRLAKIGGTDLNAIVSAYNDQFGSGAAIQSTASGVTFSSNQISGLGNAPKLVGTIAGMELNEVKGPIADALGVYMVQLTNINEAAEPDALTLQQERISNATSIQGSFSNKINTALREIADVKDARYKAGF